MNLQIVLQSKLFSNIWNQFILYGFSHIIPIVLIPFLLNTIGIEKYGLINFALAFSFYFQVVNEFGFDLSNVSHVVENRNNKQQLGHILSAIIICKIGLVILSGIIYFAIICILPNFREYWLLYTFAFIRLIGIIISPNWFFRSMQDLKYVTRIVLPIKSICILPIFVIVNSSEQYIWVIFFFMLESLLSGSLALIIALKRYNIKLQKVLLHDLVFFYKDSIPFFTSTFLTRIYQTSNTVILGFVGGESTAGIYSAAEKLHNAYISFVSPVVSQVLYPYFLSIKSFIKINKIVVLLVVGNIAILSIIYILSPYIINLFIKIETNQIITYFNLFLGVLIISVPCEALGFPYLGVMGYIKEVNFSSICTSVFYILCITILFITKHISIPILILLLALTNIVCITIRLYYIKKYQR